MDKVTENNGENKYFITFLWELNELIFGNKKKHLEQGLAHNRFLLNDI